MRHYRILVEKGPQEGAQTIVLVGEEYRYLVRVLRLREGALLEVCDGADQVWQTRVEVLKREEVTLRVEGRGEAAPAPFPLYLAQALPKGDRWDRILRQGTELGLAGFYPFFSERCVSRPDPRRLDARLERWRRILREASRQCGRTRLPGLHPPLELATLPQHLPPTSAALVLWEEEKGLALQEWLRRHPSPERVVYLIGPEGGLAPHEIDLLAQAQIPAVGLGPLILRSETAGPALAAILQFHFGLLGQ